ncbi:Hpt domain-containing protein [Sphingomonas sp. IC4-52]|uniref:Hpt domain-containing protein n=1 Tax=Sphingomonas sp. IC4-52 TaxID=2887202 RepID=UPI001D1297F9|nr:Hpt domain-containing protein [Sphingomonas sp. IC4-52]MCC2980040.1 Hpt domain-containing protein [Sphingomonas sp. IC4-52]
MNEPTDLTERMRPLRARFLKRLSEDREALLVAHAGADAAALHAICHRLAGNAGLFGFTELGGAARRVEDAIVNDQEPDLRDRLIDQLLEMLTATVQDPEP